MTNATSTEPAANSERPAVGRVHLHNRVLARVSGPGTDKFLQGQFSQNLDDVVAGHSPRAAAATPKGRTYCLTRLVRDGDDILMDLPAVLAEPITTHLRKYLMLFRGTTMTVDTDGGLSGLLGEAAARAIGGPRISELDAPGATLALDSGLLIRVESTAEGLARYELWHPGTDAPQPGDVPTITLADWIASDISAGVATLGPETSESFVPQMLNWQHLDGVHFKKGCYTGQEVIARMHFLGQLKKSLFRLGVDGGSGSPAPGTALLAGDRSVGNLVNAVRFDDGHCELLAVIRHDASGESLVIEGMPEARLSLLPLPYAVPEREKSAQPDT